MNNERGSDIEGVKKADIGEVIQSIENTLNYAEELIETENDKDLLYKANEMLDIALLNADTYHLNNQFRGRIIGNMDSVYKKMKGEETVREKVKEMELVEEGSDVRKLKRAA